jgi:hypothetical protein
MDKHQVLNKIDISKNRPFFNGPFNIKHEVYIPIHNKPPKDIVTEKKIKIPWNQASVKSHELFIWNSQKLRII